jgi:tartrate dehydratase beta subunit/fumarate hydratase class I family protein
MIAVFDDLLTLGFIEVTKESYFDRVIYQGKIIHFVATDELLARLQELARQTCASPMNLTQRIPSCLSLKSLL